MSVDNMTIDLLYIISSTVNKIPLQSDRLKHINFEMLYSIAEKQHMTAYIWYCLKDYIDLDKRWYQSYLLTLRREMLFDNERKIITDWLSQNDIWYMSLKGVHLKDLYPIKGLRYMTDNDIWYDKRRLKDVRIHMKNIGYTEEYDAHCYSYKKQPIFHFEMHHDLFSEQWGNFLNYYEAYLKRFNTIETLTWEKEFSPEDFYIYNTLHEYKHLSFSGLGIRYLFEAYLQIKTSRLDWIYIEGELQKLGVLDYEKMRRDLVLILFDNPEHCSLEYINNQLTQRQIELLDFMSLSGHHGNSDIQLRSIVSEYSSVLSYVGSVIFPSKRVMKDRYAVLKRYSFLLPIFYIYRLLSKGISRLPRVIQVIKEIKKRK